MKRALTLAALCFVSYGLVATSFRFLAKGSYIGVGTTDALIAWWGFSTMKRISEATGWKEQLGYTIGGVAGSLFGMWLTR